MILKRQQHKRTRTLKDQILPILNSSINRYMDAQNVPEQSYLSNLDSKQSYFTAGGTQNVREPTHKGNWQNFDRQHERASRELKVLVRDSKSLRLIPEIERTLSCVQTQSFNSEMRRRRQKRSNAPPQSYTTSTSVSMPKLPFILSPVADNSKIIQQSFQRMSPAHEQPDNDSVIQVNQEFNKHLRTPVAIGRQNAAPKKMRPQPQQQQKNLSSLQKSSTNQSSIAKQIQEMILLNRKSKNVELMSDFIEYQSPLQCLVLSLEAIHNVFGESVRTNTIIGSIRENTMIQEKKVSMTRGSNVSNRCFVDLGVFVRLQGESELSKQQLMVLSDAEQILQGVPGIQQLQPPLQYRLNLDVRRMHKNIQRKIWDNVVVRLTLMRKCGQNEDSEEIGRCEIEVFQQVSMNSGLQLQKKVIRSGACIVPFTSVPPTNGEARTASKGAAVCISIKYLQRDENELTQSTKNIPTSLMIQVQRMSMQENSNTVITDRVIKHLLRDVEPDQADTQAEHETSFELGIEKPQAWTKLQTKVNQQQQRKGLFKRINWAK